MTSEPKVLMEFSIKKDLLISALSHISKVATVSHLGVMVDNDKNKVGIAIIGYQSELNDSEFKTKLYADFSISDEEMINPRFSPESHPWFLISCHEKFIDSIRTLPAKNQDLLDIRLVQVKENDKDLIESQTIISGKHATAGSRIMHPENQIETGWNKLSYEPPGEMFS